jgi:hypothetical protein
MKDIFVITQQQYEEVAKRVAEFKKSPAPNFAAKELKSLPKILLPYERRLRPAADF